MKTFSNIDESHCMYINLAYSFQMHFYLSCERTVFLCKKEKNRAAWLKRRD
jgi:hypothetical protein